MSIATDREQLAKVERQISELLDTGQAYSLVGGHSVSHAQLTELAALRDKIRARILRRRGASGRVG